jgi:hypothetical protein
MQMNEDIEILPGHPDAQFLWAYLWREQGLCDDPEAIVSHLQGCDVCCANTMCLRCSVKQVWHVFKHVYWRSFFWIRRKIRILAVKMSKVEWDKAIGWC